VPAFYEKKERANATCMALRKRECEERERAGEWLQWGEMRNIRVHLLNILRQRGKQFMTPPTQHYRRFHWINVNGCFKRKKPLFVSISHYEVV
jgi:hypothetical protein